MATDYPNGIDNFINPTPSDTLDSATVPHAQQHENANDAIEAIETELGTNPKGTKADVATRLDDVDTEISDLGNTSISTSLPLTSSGTVGGDNLTIGINSASANTASYVVQRDANGNFTTGSITFDPNAPQVSAAGKLYFDGNGSLALGLLGGNVTVGINEDIVCYVTNAEATTLNIGEVVYLYGAQGDRPTVKRASNSSETTSSKTFGFVSESIGANQTGFVTIRGTVRKVNTAAFTAGDSLYLGSTPGSFTNVKPVAPNHLVYLGVVERANTGNGQIQVVVQNGYELQELHNVLISTPSNGQALVYDATTQLWKNDDVAAPISPATPTVEGVVFGLTEDNTTPLSIYDEPRKNTALGYQALNTELGVQNVAIGNDALSNTTDDNAFNVAIGASALQNNQNSFNTAVGHNSLLTNTSGSGNSALGYLALQSNTTGNNNVALGTATAVNNTDGDSNVAIGANSLYLNTVGNENLALGYNALHDNDSGSNNVALGPNSLYDNSTGDNNVAIGNSAGQSALGSDNVFIGNFAGFSETGSNKLYIANNPTTSLIVGDFSAGTVSINGTLTTTIDGGNA